MDASASGTGDGSSWANAYPSLADALAGAASGTEIWVAKGTYKPTSGSDRTATFQLKDGVAIYGGFAGGETQRDQRDWQANLTTLSGDLNGDDSGAVSLSNPTLADKSYSVVTGETGATFDGVTITGGYATDSFGSPPPKFGGGMYNDNSSPTLASVTLRRHLLSDTAFHNLRPNILEQASAGEQSQRLATFPSQPDSDYVPS